MNRFYKLWFLATLVAIPLILFWVNRPSQGVQPQHTSAREKLRHSKNTPSENFVRHSEEREGRAEEAGVAQVLPSKKSPLDWIQKDAPQQVGGNTVKPKAAPVSKKQRPVQLAPSLPHEHAMIGGRYVHPTRIIARYATGHAGKATAGAVSLQNGGQEFSQVALDGNGIVALESVQPDGNAPETGGEAQDVIEAVQKGDELMEKIKALQESGEFEFVEPDFVITISGTPSDSAFVDGRLWGLRNTGQSGGVSGVDVNAVRAWEVTTGSTDVVVAVIDTGIRYTHQDLQQQMWVNTDEVAGNGVDDDNDGYVDNIYGMDAVNDDGDPMDDNNHGTHCAGTIGARANDGNPHVGVAWQVRLMACKFLSGSGWGYTSGAIRCVDFAVENGAHVLSNSWGGGGFSQALHDSIANARDQGVLFIAAAGNSGADADERPHYPSSYELDNVISVAAMNRHGNLASWSNYGATSVDLAAPGVEIYSSTAGSDSEYSSYSGTSMACPHVAGVAGLLMARTPGASIEELRQRLLSTVVPMDSLNGKVASGGRVDAYQALVGGEDGDLELNLSSLMNPLRGGRTATLVARVTDLVPIIDATVTGSAEGIGDLVFLDNGVAPDVTANDGVYSTSLTVPVDPDVTSIQVTATASKEGKNSASATLSLEVSHPPINDFFDDRTVLTGKHHVVFTGDSEEATREAGEPAHHYYRRNRGGKSLWWSWTARQSGEVEINTIGSNFDTILAVYTGTDLSVLRRVASDDDRGGNWTSLVTFNAVAGTTYQIAVDGYGGRWGDIRGEIILVNEVSPSNDHFVNALELDGTTNHQVTFGSNIGATRENGEPSHSNRMAGKSVWWKWTPQTDLQVTLSTWTNSGSQSPFWSCLAIYTGDSVDQLSSVARSTRQVRFQALAGTTYRIAVDGVSWRGGRPKQGSFRIVLDGEPFPANDHFANAAVLSGSQASAIANNVHASRESGEPSHSDNRGGKSLWWSWTAPSTGTAKVETQGSTFDTILAVYQGDTLAELTPIASDDNSADNYTSKLSFTAEQGATYRIAVDGKYSSRWRWTEEGQISLNILQVPTIEDPALAEAVDTSTLTLQTGGNAQWRRQTAVFNNGDDAAESGVIGHNESTWISTIVTGEATLSFFWKISSETDCDFLKFYIDGEEAAAISGEMERIESFDITAGQHELKWVYSKDASVSGGQDRAWLDLVTVLPKLSVRFTHYHPQRDGGGRKWFTSADGAAYYIRRDGRIFRHEANGDTIIGAVDRGVFEAPRQLVWPSLPNLSHDATRDEPNRKWLTDGQGKSYYITADGQIYCQEPRGDLLLGRVDKNRFENPNLLARPTVDFIQYHSDLDETGRKWFTGIDGNRYYILENGGVYRSNSDGLVLAGGLNPDYYQSPALLVWPTIAFKEHIGDRDELGRKWLTDISGDSYYITHTGGIYKESGEEASAQPFAGVSADRFDTPQLLIRPEVKFTVYDPTQDETSSKWLKDAGDKWYYVNGRGDVYSWDESTSTSKLLGGVHPTRFQNPLLLVRPTFAFAEYLPDNDQPTERWLKDFQNNWYFVSPNGGIFEYDDESGEGTLIGGVNICEFMEPQLMIWPTVVFTQHHTDRDAADKKWFSDANGGNYYVTSEGRVYQEGTSGSFSDNSNLIGRVSKELFQETEKLIVPSGMFTAYHSQWDGEDRKWFTDSSGDWHFLNESGEVFRWSHPSEPFSGTSAGNDKQANTLNLRLDSGFEDTSSQGQTVTPVGDARILQSGEAGRYGGGAAHFDGWGDYLKIPSNRLFEDTRGSFTVEMRFQAKSGNSEEWQYLTGMYRPGAHSFGLWYYREKLHIWASNKNKQFSVRWLKGSRSVKSEEWHHVALVNHDKKWEVYVDGVKDCSYLDTSQMYRSWADLNIGGTWHYRPYSFSGLIDEFKFSSEAKYSENFNPDAFEEPVTPIATIRISPLYFFQPSNLLD